MTIICAWCGKTLQRGGGEVSHGICAACSAKVESRFVTHWPAPSTGARRRRPPVAPSHPLPGFWPAEALAAEAT